MKRYISVVLSLILLFSLCSCGKTPNEAESSPVESLSLVDESSQTEQMESIPDESSQAESRDNESSQAKQEESTQTEPEETGPACVSICRESDLDRSFSEYIDCVIDKDGESAVIYSDRTITNVEVCYADVDYETLGVKFGKTIAGSITLTPGNALRVRLFIPDVLPTVFVRYDDKDSTTKAFAIFQSGEDGSMMKLDVVGGKLPG